MTEPKREIDLKSLARAYTEHSIRVLGGYVVGDGVDPEHKLSAIKILLDRGWGRPEQKHDAKVEGDINITVRNIMEGRK